MCWTLDFAGPGGKEEAQSAFWVCWLASNRAAQMLGKGKDKADEVKELAVSASLDKHKQYHQTGYDVSDDKTCHYFIFEAW